VKAPKKQDHRWEVFVLREKAKHIGYVQAPDAKSAIEVAKVELNIPSNLWGKISVEPR
jgi:1,2-phenylacetyl-CoA epoxidase PaaB subunit